MNKNETQDFSFNYYYKVWKDRVVFWLLKSIKILYKYVKRLYVIFYETLRLIQFQSRKLLIGQNSVFVL